MPGSTTNPVKAGVEICTHDRFLTKELLSYLSYPATEQVKAEDGI